MNSDDNDDDHDHDEDHNTSEAEGVEEVQQVEAAPDDVAVLNEVITEPGASLAEVVVSTPLIMKVQGAKTDDVTTKDGDEDKETTQVRGRRRSRRKTRAT
mmetsp:Transcript_31347/g.35085  ORF Transcript_31347/g.35085 Transcript_31347/m.35085 type:complete len:100 (+) Transcript_31347:124-423(+)